MRRETNTSKLKFICLIRRGKNLPFGFINLKIRHSSNIYRSLKPVQLDFFVSKCFSLGNDLKLASKDKFTCDGTNSWISIEGEINFHTLDTS